MLECACQSGWVAMACEESELALGPTDVQSAASACAVPVLGADLRAQGLAGIAG